jgi:hypothetical protein
VLPIAQNRGKEWWNRRLELVTFGTLTLAKDAPSEPPIESPEIVAWAKVAASAFVLANSRDLERFVVKRPSR